ncbi:MAG: beta-ketoacyl-[acyl-carrier-protein] synthase family protein [Deltaproteobacteria bacterium]|nr:beta-ketoacyl-[acyl-carrier-protein] synthase family protein [Deltaproteobacteria bacterium]
MTRKRRVVVTGLGLATPLGLDVEGNWGKLLGGLSGIGPVSLPGSDASPIRAVGEVNVADLRRIRDRFPDDSLEQGERRTLFALWAAASALRDAGLSNTYGNRQRFGIAAAAGVGTHRLEDLSRWTAQQRNFDVSRFMREFGHAHPASILKNSADRPASLISRRFRLYGANLTLTSACASATLALGMGYRRVASGEADLMVAGGADSMLNPIGLVFFLLLTAASTSRDRPETICRPFDRKRSGLVIGEGAGFAVLEDLSHALERGARIYAEVAGCGTSLDAHSVTAPEPRGRGIEAAMVTTLNDAGLKGGDIDHINAHATGTRLNDVAETIAIKRVFKNHAARIPISASKSMIGHLMAAAGGPEFIYTVMSVARDEVHPTINLENPDPACDLDYVPEGKRHCRVRGSAVKTP